MFLAFLSLDSVAQSAKYSKAKVTLSNTNNIQKLASTGVAVDHGEFKKDAYFISDFSAEEIIRIQNKGFAVEVLIDDVQKFYVERNSSLQTAKTENINTNCNTSSPNIISPVGFQLGSMGGFFTYAEFLAHLDTMAARFPNLITIRQTVGTFNTYEGRPLYWLKISDNPNVDENEPEILYTALHHAREAASLSQQIFYMYYLLENYATNPTIKQLVDNTEMYFIPMVNPDGYIYNQTINPNGGGMWRKNRRPIGTAGTYGVDLNRNYGYEFGYDNNGSSPDSTTDTYRGSSGFSEAETQATKWFTEQHQFKMCINYHTYGNLLIYPWGFIPDYYTPDSALFVNYANLLTTDNHYKAGTGIQTVGYTVNGSSDDWMYGEQGTKPKILSMTPEAGSPGDGFWPQINNIENICKENVTQNLYGAKLIGKYAIVKDLENTLIPVTTGHLKYNITRLGLDSPAAFTVTIIPLDSWISSVGGPKVYAGMNLLQSINDSVAYTLNSSITNGQAFRYAVKINNGLYDEVDTLTKIYGQSNIVYSSNGSTITGWTSAGSNWGISNTEFYSPSASITDSPNGNYADNTNKLLTLNTPVDLTNAITAKLTFYAKWDIEAGYDYVEVLASSNGGATYTPLCGKYTKPGSTDQDPGKPLFDGQQFDWVYEEMDLDNYVGHSIKLRFKLTSDQGVDGDGFYFDDLKVISINTLGAGIGSNNIFDNSIQISPNPLNNESVINVNVEESNSSLKIYNSLGQAVKTITLSKGINNVMISADDFNNGVYYCFVEGTNGKVLYENKKLVVCK